MILDSLLPVVLVIATGYAARASGLLPDAQWRGFEAVSYQIFFPALMVVTLASSDIRSAPVVAMGGTLVLGSLALLTLTLAAWPLLLRPAGISGPAFTSVVQGVIRWNSFVAIALSAALHGREGLTAVSLAVAVLTPIANIASLAALARWGTIPRPPDIGRALLQLLANPFMWSTIIGILLSLSGIALPKAIMSWIDMLGRAALGAGLLMVGAGLRLEALRRPDAALGVAIVLKLMVSPLLMAGIGHLLGLGGVPLAVVIISTAVPTAAASFVLARQGGGDAEAMAAIVTAQTIVAAITLPLALAWLA
jgi:hypothetical protein